MHGSRGYNVNAHWRIISQYLDSLHVSTSQCINGSSSFLRRCSLVSFAAVSQVDAGTCPDGWTKFRDSCYRVYVSDDWDVCSTGGSQKAIILDEETNVSCAIGLLKLCLSGRHFSSPLKNKLPLKLQFKINESISIEENNALWVSMIYWGCIFFFPCKRCKF